MLEKYVVQLPRFKSLVDLKKEFSSISSHSGRATVLNDVGIIAVRNKCKDSIFFLIKNLDHEQVDVRRVAIDYLGDLSPQHPLFSEARKALEKSIDKIKDEKSAPGGLHGFAVRSLERIEKRSMGRRIK